MSLSHWDGSGLTFRVLLALELRDLLHGGCTRVRAEVSVPPILVPGAMEKVLGNALLVGRLFFCLENTFLP